MVGRALDAGRKVWVGLLISAAVGLAGCSEPALKGAACLPEPARAYLGAAVTPEEPAASRAAVRVYVDGSGSMVGYLRGAAGTERRPFQDFLAKLPSAAAGGASSPADLQIQTFGAELHSIEADRLDRLVSEAAYTCSPGQPCDNQESRLDLALADARSAPAEALSVIISDLWLSGRELATTAQTAVGAPLAAMLSEGRSVGVVGVQAPYSGPVYDLPGGGSYLGATARPLYILLIGPAERVEAVRRWYQQDGTPGFGPEESQFSLFSLDALRSDSEAGRPRFEGAAFRPTVFLPPAAGLDIGQATLSTGAALRERLNPGAAPSQLRHVADPQVRARPGAVWRGPAEGDTRVWRLSKWSPCEANAWTPTGAFPEGWSGPDGLSFVLPAATAAARLPKGGDYLLVSQVRRTGLAVPNPANDWMRAWSFNAAQAPSVIAARPALFPTLNLAETARQMEAALAEAAANRPVELGGFAAVVRVED